jgi:hypothetical protein
MRTRPPRKANTQNVYEPTVTAPDSIGARGEREASYFAAALWGPKRRCPENLAGQARRFRGAGSSSIPDFSRHTPKPPKLSTAQRLAFERDSGEANT